MAGILGGLGTAIGGMIGAGEAQPMYDKADQQRQDAINAFRGLSPQQQAQEVGKSQLGQIGGQQTRADQLQALSALKSRYQSGGLDAQAKADVANVNAQAGAQAAAQRAAVQNTAAQRGLASSGASLASQRQAAQQAANTSSQAGMNALAMGQNRADAALGQYANQATGVRGQDYGQAAQAAQANDAIAQFNANQRTNASQNSFNNAYGQAAGVASQDQNAAKGLTDDGDRKKATDTGIGGAIGSSGDGILSLVGGL